MSFSRTHIPSSSVLLLKSQVPLLTLESVLVTHGSSQFFLAPTYIVLYKADKLPDIAHVNMFE